MNYILLDTDEATENQSVIENEANLGLVQVRDIATELGKNPRDSATHYRKTVL